MGYSCFLFTSDFRVEEEELVDKILCLFGEKQIESMLQKANENCYNKNKAKSTQQLSLDLASFIKL